MIWRRLRERLRGCRCERYLRSEGRGGWTLVLEEEGVKKEEGGRRDWLIPVVHSPCALRFSGWT